MNVKAILTYWCFLWGTNVQMKLPTAADSFVPFPLRADDLLAQRGQCGREPALSG